MVKYAIKIRTQYKNDHTNKELSLPAIYTENGLLVSHLRYLAENAYKSGSWQDRSVFSVMLLIQYINANQSAFENATSLLQSFAQCLTLGTVHPSTLEDESQLYWPARSYEDANTLLGHITAYTDWLSEQAEYPQQRINKFRKATSVEQRLNWCAYYHKHARVFLNHLSMANKVAHSMGYSRQVRAHQKAAIQVSTSKRFPSSDIRRLLDVGMIRPRDGVNELGNPLPDYKNQAITLLLHYGGVRKSEVFHLYLSLNENQRISKGSNCFLFRDFASEEPGHFSGRLATRLSVALYHTQPSDLHLASLSKDKTVLNHYTSRYTPHSMRVSLITAYVEEFGLPLQIIMKVSGHSSIVMAVYYCKIGSENLRRRFDEGEKRAMQDKSYAAQRMIEQGRIDEIKNELIATTSDALNLISGDTPVGTYLFRDYLRCNSGIVWEVPASDFSACRNIEEYLYVRWLMN